MKTVESRIKKEAAGKVLVDLMMVKLDRWAKHEIDYLRYALNVPVILPFNEKTWMIGKFVIKHMDSDKFHVTEDGKFIHTFYSKKAAVFYAVLIKLQQYQTANEILTKDRKLAKFNDEVVFYFKRLSQNKKIDNFKLQLWQMKLIEAKAQSAIAKEELRKILSNVKYMKVWSKIFPDQTSIRIT